MVRTLLIFTVLSAQAMWLFRPVLPYVEYAINKGYIAEVLCINKEKPQLECDGKCYLRARIQEETQPPVSIPGVVHLAPEWDLLFTVVLPQVEELIPTAETRISFSEHPLLPGELHLSTPTPPPRLTG